MHASVLVGYLVLSLALTYPAAFSFTTHIPIAHQIPGWVPGDGDPWINMWSLWFAYDSLLQVGRSPFFTDHLFYPRGVDLLHLIWFMLPLLLSIPLLRLIGLVATHNLLILCSLTLAGYAAFLLVEYLVKDRRAAFISGLIFAFSPYHMARSVEHLFLLASALWVPLYILFMIRTLRKGGLTNVGLAALCLIFTVFSNPYYAIFQALFTGVYVVYHLWCPWPDLKPRVLLKRLSWLVVLASLPLLPVLRYALIREWTDISLYVPLSTVNVWSADLLAFFIPSSDHPVWGRMVEPIYRNFSGNVFEQTVYIGYVVFIFSCLAPFLAPRQDTRFWCFSALTFFILSLGPVLHINGRYLFEVDGLKLMFPLPALLLHFLPITRAIMVYSRFDVMVMLSLAVLAGYALRAILNPYSHARGGPRTRTAFLGIVSAGILFEFLSLPLPVLDARIPRVYEAMSHVGGRDGTLLEVPLDAKIAKYQYYQTAHHKKLIMGYVDHPSRSLVGFADTLPFISVFKNPALVSEYEQHPVRKRDVLRFIEFFDLDFLVLHKDYFGPEVFGPLFRFILAHFPITRIEEEGDIVALQLSRTHQGLDLSGEEDGHIVDFGSLSPQFFLFEGWSSPERWGELTATWSDAKESRLWVFFARPEDFVMELRLLPFVYPGSPPQRVKIYVNERFLNEIHLEAQEWQSYVLLLPRTYLTTGINRLRFAYHYTASPATVLPGSTDSRKLAVAFDFIAFRRE